MKTYPITNGTEFKGSNLDNWKANADFWFAAKLRHLPHVRPLAETILTRESKRVGPGFIVADIGCGEGWILRTLAALGVEYRYIGLDFNPLFLERLQKEHASKAVSFQMYDIEQALPGVLTGSADVVVNAFNFFELANLESAFANTVAMIRGHGGLLVFHIDPLSQMLCLTNSLEELREGLASLEEHGARLGYDKTIDLQDGTADRVYKGILYSLSDYHRLATTHGLVLEDFHEVLRVKGGRPQWYQVAFWRKP